MTSTIRTSLKRIGLVLTLAGFFAVSSRLAAQVSASTAEGPPAKTDDNQKSDTIVLSQFDVTSTTANGYRATNSVTATGIGAPNYEVPLQIEVLTTQFMQDVDASDVRDALRNIAGVVVDTRNESSFTVRGYNGNISYRNGFYRRQNYQDWDIDRVEVIFGPAAIFYGNVRPGGIVNYVTRRPDFKGSFVDALAEVGSFSLLKGDLDYNAVLNDKVALRVNVGGLDSNGHGRNYDFLTENSVSLAATWKIAQDQVLNFYFDRQRRNDYPLERGDAITHEGYLGNATALANNYTVQQYVQFVLNGGTANGAKTPIWTTWAPVYGASDPYGKNWAFDRKESYETFRDFDFDLSYDAKIRDNIVWQTAISRGQDDQPGFRVNGTGSSVDISPLADGSFNNLQYQAFENNRNSRVVKNTLTVKFDTWDFHHTLILGQQYQAVQTDQPGYINSSGAFSTNNLTAANWFVGFKPGLSPLLTGGLAAVYANQPLNNWVHGFGQTIGYLAVMQTSFWHNRVHALYGGRYNVVNGSISYSVRPTNPGVVSRNTALTPQTGIIAEVLPGLSVFGTYSRSMEPQNGTIDFYGNTAPPIRDVGWDFGVKTQLLDGRISTTVDFFDSQRNGLATEDTAREAALGNTIRPLYIFGQAYDVRGIAFDSNISLSESDQLVLSYQHLTKANYTASPFPNDQFVGQPIADTPTNMFSLWNRYEFKSDLAKGLVVGLGARFQSDAAFSSNPQITVRLPEFWVFNAMVQKKVKVFSHEVQLQFNVNNLANKDYREGTNGEFAPPREFFFSAKTRF